MWQCSAVWEQQQHVEIVCMKKLRADYKWELSVNIQSKILCIPFRYAVM